MFIADSIGEDYLNWEPNSCIFIASPTGSGKTTFILEKLLLHAYKENKKILYLVNRTILKKQMEQAIQVLPLELRSYISIELYQTIENEILNLTGQIEYPEFQQGYLMAIQDHVPAEKQSAIQDNLLLLNKTVYRADGYNALKKYQDFPKNQEYEEYQEYERYKYVVCDEAHYFLMDSNYNTNTVLSYKFVKDFFSNKIRIFMSATIDQIQKYIEGDEKKGRFGCTPWYEYPYKPSVAATVLAKKDIIYNIERNYDYLDINIIFRREEIADLVVSGSEKWLIFVDSKEFGKKLKSDILKSLPEEDSRSPKEVVSFITSDYALDSESSEEVIGIVNSSKQLAQVLIATSVLDNGINLKDIELRNVIIITDTETEFIQMLGRKRRDEGRLKVYIYKQDREHFVRRERICSRRERIAEETYMFFEKNVKKKMAQYIGQRKKFVSDLNQCH